MRCVTRSKLNKQNLKPENLIRESRVFSFSDTVSGVRTCAPGGGPYLSQFASGPEKGGLQAMLPKPRFCDADCALADLQLLRDSSLPGQCV